MTVFDPTETATLPRPPAGGLDDQDGPRILTIRGSRYLSTETGLELLEAGPGMTAEREAEIAAMMAEGAVNPAGNPYKVGQ